VTGTAFVFVSVFVLVLVFAFVFVFVTASVIVHGTVFVAVYVIVIVIVIVTVTVTVMLWVLMKIEALLIGLFVLHPLVKIEILEVPGFVILSLLVSMLIVKVLLTVVLYFEHLETRAERGTGIIGMQTDTVVTGMWYFVVA
jgi:hypothetical protein